MAEIIDIERKGNLIRFYLGKNGDQWGDDWDDAPYEHNAGVVYDKYVEYFYDITIPFDVEVMEPSDYSLNSDFSKEDMVNGKIYCLELFSGGESICVIKYGDNIGEITRLITMSGILKKSRHCYKCITCG